MPPRQSAAALYFSYFTLASSKVRPRMGVIWGNTLMWFGSRPCLFLLIFVLDLGLEQGGLESLTLAAASALMLDT